MLRHPWVSLMRLVSKNDDIPLWPQIATAYHWIQFTRGYVFVNRRYPSIYGQTRGMNRPVGVQSQGMELLTLQVNLLTPETQIAQCMEEGSASSQPCRGPVPDLLAKRAVTCLKRRTAKKHQKAMEKAMVGRRGQPMSPDRSCLGPIVGIFK